MKLWKLSQDVISGYDTYDSAVVAAETEELARQFAPSGEHFYREGHWWSKHYDGTEYRTEPLYIGWPYPDQLTVEYLGEATEGIEPGVVCASFNAG